MSEATHYWPGPDDLGVYDLVHHSGAVWREAMWTGEKWVAKGPPGGAIEPLEVISWGYLGVRREAEKPIIARVTLRDGGEHKPPRNALSPDPDDGSAMVAQQALDELRACQTKPAESERWFYKWGPVLCQMLGAR